MHRGDSARDNDTFWPSHLIRLTIACQNEPSQAKATRLYPILLVGWPDCCGIDDGLTGTKKRPPPIHVDDPFRWTFMSPTTLWTALC
jgi:hypothetical protein